jgi:uncharacterized protein YbaR (Trm112 family)
LKANNQAYLPNLDDPTPRSSLKRRLLDILACPIDKHYPLELYVFEEKEEITEGLLFCTDCNRWYPISDEIPQMLPDDLREAKEDLEWMRRWKSQIPDKVLADGKPFRLSP